MTLEQVKEMAAFSDVIVKPNYTMGIVFFGLALIFIIVLLYFLKKEQYREKFSHLVIIGVSSVVIMFSLVFALEEFFSPNQQADYEIEQAQTIWTHRAVLPYLETQLTTEPIEQIEFDTEKMWEMELTNYSIKSDRTYIEKDYMAPVQIETLSGEQVTGWAKVKPLAADGVERVEYAKLEEDLVFGVEANREDTQTYKNYPEGYYLITVYTDQNFWQE